MLQQDTDLQMFDNFRTNNPQTQIRNFIALLQINGLKSDKQRSNDKKEDNNYRFIRFPQEHTA